MATGNRVRSLVVEDADSNLRDIIVQNGKIVGNVNREFCIVTLSFLAEGGDGYPIEQFIAENADRANRVDLVNLDLAAGAATFTDAILAAILKLEPQTDLSVEGLTFILAADSANSKPLLVTANEIKFPC